MYTLYYNTDCENFDKITEIPLKILKNGGVNLY